MGVTPDLDLKNLWSKVGSNKLISVSINVDCTWRKWDWSCVELMITLDPGGLWWGIYARKWWSDGVTWGTLRAIASMDVRSRKTDFDLVVEKERVDSPLSFKYRSSFDVFENPGNFDSWQREAHDNFSALYFSERTSENSECIKGCPTGVCCPCFVLYNVWAEWQHTRNPNHLANTLSLIKYNTSPLLISPSVHII